MCLKERLRDANGSGDDVAVGWKIADRFTLKMAQSPWERTMA